ncbi:MAG: acetylxylan esterase, partial [Opitutaceae bacterium]|nr:acetylxylan esterase [Opitutaceae bacterium]
MNRLRFALSLFAVSLLPDIGRAQFVSSAISVLPAQASASPLTITPDRADWTYVLGAPASFRIQFSITPYPAAGVSVRYKLGPEMREGAEISAVVPAEGLVVPVPPALAAAPGFVRCIVTASLDAKPVRALATIGFAPESITPTQTDAPDFDTFWAEQKAALAKVAPDYQLTPAPDLSNADVEVFYLSFQNVGGWSGPSRFYGVLSVPRGPGPFPAVLNVPGAGVRAYSGNRSLAAKGVITLQVGIHGIPVNLPPEVYEQLSRGALADYNRNQLDDPTRYYYRRVYLGALRAADYLTTHPKWDGKNLIVSGGSQGGQLAIVTTALEPRVTGLVSIYPAYSDVTGYLRGTTGGWPGLFRTNREGKVSDAPIEAKVVTTTYYDTVNFARRLRVPCFYSWGYNDETCPTTSTFAAYNIITAPKQLRLDLPQGHSTSKTQQQEIDAWILAQVGIAKP